MYDFLQKLTVTELQTLYDELHETNSPLVDEIGYRLINTQPSTLIDVTEIEIVKSWRNTFPDAIEL